MSVLERVVDAQNRLYERLRHPDAWRPEMTAGGGLEHLRGHKYALIITYRRDGRPVPTAVWFGLDAGKVYVRTERRAGKVKRIRNDPRASIAPSTFRAKPLAPAVEGRARVVAPEEEEHAERALASNYGRFRRAYERFGERVGADMVYLEIAPARQGPEAG